ncbi:MAG TPA: hypothetical protein VF669_00530, partial [Tepidisphaeraceae bacterium]
MRSRCAKTRRSLRLWYALVALLLFFTASAASLRAQALPSVDNGFRNIFSRKGPPTLADENDPSIPPNDGGDLRKAYDAQFRSNTAIGGWRTTRITSGPDGTGTVLAGSPTTTLGPTTLIRPAGGGVQLASAVMGRPIVTFAVS